jgi:hypothetical protein
MYAISHYNNALLFIVEPIVVRSHTPEEKCVLHDAETIFKRAIINVLGGTIVGAYMWLSTRKELCNAFEVKYGVSHANSELYVMEQIHDYRMVDDHSIVEQAQEVKHREESLKFFVVCCQISLARCIISKLSQTHTVFATSLKHKYKSSTCRET